MKMLDRESFIQALGAPLTQARDFSLYDGAPYECVCGQWHSFNQFSGRAFGSTGASAKFLVECPNNKNAATIIKTKNKYIILFDKFISIAGHVDDRQ